MFCNINTIDFISFYQPLFAGTRDICRINNKHLPFERQESPGSRIPTATGFISTSDLMSRIMLVHIVFKSFRIRNEKFSCIGKWKIEQMEKKKPVWDVRIGIHTGPLVAGVVGKKKFAYDIWGNAVNIASRMESSGEADRLNISAVTYELVKDQYDCEFRGKIYAKNVGDIDMYFVNSKKTEASVPLIKKATIVP